MAFFFSRNAHELAGGLQAVGAPPKVDFLVLIDGLPGGLQAGVDRKTKLELDMLTSFAFY